ncbi:MAG: hypothetical protein HKP27_00220 [Myxococcales bacterium]|nr:hypothetical protein [Myxococcales bacterium]
MSEIRRRAKELSPSLVLTLLSIVQALALEVLWSSVRESAFLFEGGLPAAIGWAQVSITLQGIVVLWVAYVSLVVRFVWVPRVSDVVTPFVLGVLEFILASALDPSWLVPWLLALAALFVVATVTNANVFDAASELPENREHFDELEKLEPGAFGPTALYGPLAVFVALILGAAALAAFFGADSWAALAGLLITNGVLILQFMQIRRYWNRSLFQLPADQ